MKSSVDLYGATTLTLSEALLIYRPKSDVDRAYITHHHVTGDQIGPAQPLTRDFVNTLARELGRGMLEILPQNILARTPDVTVWWTPAQRRTMFFTGDRIEKFPLLNGSQFPQPPLVWMATAHSLYIRALRENARPTADTPLYIAPYWNVNSEGLVCTGSMQTPDTRSVDAIKVWEDGFFRSEFSHPNASKIVSFSEGYLNWLAHILRHFEAAGNDLSAYLIDAKQTFARFLQGAR